MPELKQRFEELERLPAPDLQRRIQVRIQRLQQADHPVSDAEQAWRHRERLWPWQVLATAAVIVFALGLGIALLQVRSRAPVQTHPSPSAAPQPSPSIAGVYPPGFNPGSLHMVSPTVGWNGFAYVETSDGGLHWRVISSPPAIPNEIKGALGNFALDATHAWVTGATDHGLVVTRSVDGGRTWGLSAPLPALIQIRGGNAAVQLDFIDAQHGWLVVDTAGSASPNSRAVFTTSDGGRGWREIASASESDGSFLGRLAAGCTPSGITFISLDSGWLTYDCTRSNGAPPPPRTGPVVAVTGDAGRSWNAVSLPSYPSGSGYFTASPPIFTQDNGILPVFFRGIGDSWIGIYRTTDGGRTWTLHRLPFLTLELDFVDAHTGWAVKQTGPTPPSPSVNCYVVICPASAELYRTSDGGATWKLISQLHPIVNGMGFVDSKVGYYGWSERGLEGSPGGVMKTTDGGRSWSLVRPVMEGQG